MASPHLPGQDEHHGLTPHVLTTTTSTAESSLSPANASHPPSPNAIAAAVTLATLADNRPPTSDGDPEPEAEEEVEDDDHGGGISLEDFQHFVEAPIQAHTTKNSPRSIPEFQSVMAQFESWPQPLYSSTLDSLDPLSTLSMFIQQPPEPPIFVSHLSSSANSLEPPPTLQEVHLSIQDKTSYAPITSFFHYLSHEKPTVPGLDLIQVPPSIVREDLKGDRYDYQGIDWVVRNTTRSSIRAKRAEYEGQKLPPSLREVRKVCTHLLISLACG